MVYVILWLLVLFMVLPFGVTTLISAALWGIIYFVIEAGWITFRGS